MLARLLARQVAIASSDRVPKLFGFTIYRIILHVQRGVWYRWRFARQKGASKYQVARVCYHPVGWAEPIWISLIEAEHYLADIYECEVVAVQSGDHAADLIGCR